MLNILFVLAIYSSVYAGFTCLGLGFSRAVFSSRTYYAGLLTPIFGLAIFCLMSTMFMNHYTGAVAGHLGLMVTAMLSAGLYFGFNNKVAPLRLKRIIALQKLGFFAGLIFLLPLFLVGDYGIFALNGADFGSYAGWGQYFQNYTLWDAFPHTDPVNFTQKAFTNLQTEITRPEGHWRIGNISLFAGLCSLLPNHWPTLYTTCIAFLMAQFTLAMQLFARAVFFQTLSNATKIGLFSLLLNTIVWLAMAHYVPNIAGVVLSLLLVVLFLKVRKFNVRLALATSVLLGTLVLLYPENFIFFGAILFVQVLAQVQRLSVLFPWKAAFYKGRPFAILLVFLLSAGLAYGWTAESFVRCVRHLVGIMGYNRPGDYVGIDLWGYLSQGIGFVDYNGLLRSNDIFWWLGFRPEYSFWHSNIFWLHTVLVVNYVAAFSLLAFGVLSRAQTQQKIFGKRAYLVMLAFLLILSLPIINYYHNDQYLLAWRSLLTISPYTWIMICIAALNAYSVVSVSKKADENLGILMSYRFAVIIVWCFVALLSTSIVVRGLMIKNIAFGATHAAIFGEALEKSITYLQAQKNYDLVFVDYEGSGTIQAGWEFYAQNIAYIFPQHGNGRNEYSIVPLVGKNIAIISDNYSKVEKLIGFKQDFSSFRGRKVLFTNNNNILQLYSGTWNYNKENQTVTLLGMPGKLLLWLKQDSKACLSMSVKSSRENAYLRITVNNGSSVQKPVTQINKDKLCYSFHKGLNIIRLEPIFIDKTNLQGQKRYISDKGLAKDLTEQELALYAIYSGAIKEVNPLVSPTVQDFYVKGSKATVGKAWNLVTPPDIFPFNPHLVFEKIEIKRVGKG